MPTAGESTWFLRSCIPEETAKQRFGPISCDMAEPVAIIQKRCNGTVAALQRKHSEALATSNMHARQQAPPPRYNKEVLELLGDSEDAMRKRWSEMKSPRQRVDVRAYLQDCWDKVDSNQLKQTTQDQMKQYNDGARMNLGQVCPFFGRNNMRVMDLAFGD